jgi:HlyD family secretion protein
VSGQQVGAVDTAQAALQLAEARAQLAAGRAQIDQSGAQAAALEAQLGTARLEHSRTVRLFEDSAATRQQLEQATGRIETLEAQLRAAREQTSGSRQQTEALTARVALLEDRLQRSNIVNPVTGTVLTTFAEAGEFVQPGQPLFEIASLDTLVLRAYVSGSQLTSVMLGAEVGVIVDGGLDGRRARTGTISWIAGAAEFTPTPIQTREERVDLVYAIKIRVPNPDGSLKIGMPGEVILDVDGSDVAAGSPLRPESAVE